jgi:L-cysteine/cystine lyase
MSPYLPSDTVRSAFPALQDVVYLNTGTYGLMPDPALQAFQDMQADFERYGVAAKGNLGAKAEEARKRFASLINAAPEEIAFTRNATDGINLVLAGLDWQPGDEVITTDEEHPAMAHPLLYLQRTRGIQARWLDISPEPAVMLERLEAVVSPRTRLIAMSHVPCETGTRLPAREICAWATARGILTLFDGAQAFGAFRVDVRDLGCDFYTTNGHKWGSGPKGTGMFYARKDRLAALSPAHVGAGSLEKADVATGEAEPWATGGRFEFGTRSWGVYAGFGASLDWFDALGWDNVERHIHALSDYLKEHVLERPYLTLCTPEAFEQSSGLTSISMPGHYAGDVSTFLRERRIHVRVVHHVNGIRISTAHFNTEADVDALMAALDELAKPA